MISLKYKLFNFFGLATKILRSNMFLLSLLVVQFSLAAYARSFTADGGQTAAAGCGRCYLVSSPKEKRGESSPCKEKDC